MLILILIATAVIGTISLIIGDDNDDDVDGDDRS